MRCIKNINYNYKLYFFNEWFLIITIKLKLFFIWWICFRILSWIQENVITRSFTSLNWAFFMYKKREVAICLCIFSFSLFLKSLFRFTSHTNPPLIVFLRPTHECTNTNTLMLWKLCSSPIASSDFRSKNPFFNLSLSSYRSLYLSPTHTKKKKVLLFSYSRAFIPYITLFLFHDVFIFKFWIFITACGKQILGLWWVWSHTLLSLEIFSGYLSFPFGVSIVMLNWLHANGFSFKFFVERFDFEFWVFFFVVFGLWIDLLMMNLCAFQFWCSVSMTCGKTGPGILMLKF